MVFTGIVEEMGKVAALKEEEMRAFTKNKKRSRSNKTRPTKRARHCEAPQLPPEEVDVRDVEAQLVPP